MVVVGNFSQFVWAYSLKQQSDIPAVFASFQAHVRGQGNPSIVECLRSDNGTKFVKGDFVALVDHTCCRHSELVR